MRSFEPIRPRLERLLRLLSLLTLADRVRYVVTVVRNHRANADFVRHHPDFVLPPKHLAYEAYSAPCWDFYRRSGEQGAAFVAEMAWKHVGTERLGRVYEWGCGPGRVIRQLPRVLGPAVRVYGSDCSAETIAWCRKHIEGVQFFRNSLAPPLPLAAHAFDCVYGVSVLSHLPQRLAEEWAGELERVLRPGGILLLTTKGDAYRDELLPDERDRYQSVGFVERSRAQEGTKLYATFHAPSLVRARLLHRYEVVEHTPSGFPWMSQDLWIARKPASG